MNPKTNPHLNRKKAALFAILSALFLSMMAVFVKLAAAHTSNNMIVLFRFSISFLYIILILGARKIKGESVPIKTKHFGLHLFRAIVSVMAMLLFYYSLKYIPLVDGNLLVMTNALFIPILATLFLRAKTSAKNWAAIIIGFIGVVFILKPGHELFDTASLIGLAAGLCSAFALLAVRNLSKYDHVYTCMFYYFPLAFLFSGVISIFHWQTPNLHTIFLLIGVGIFGTIYQEFLIRASAYAPAKIVSTLMYTSLIFSGFLGWSFWGEIPSLLSWFGIALVCLGSILAILTTETE